MLAIGTLIRSNEGDLFAVARIGLAASGERYRRLRKHAKQ
jgi:hypothetical protein